MRSGISRNSGRTCVLLLVLLLSTAGCTNSKLIIGPLYNQLDNQIRSEFNKLGDFNDVQMAAFEASVGTYHVWHRQSELPRYAALMSEVARSIATPGNTREQDVKRWAETAETFSRSARLCHPVNYLFDLFKSLSDQQINFIERRFQNERKKNRERYESRSAEERVDYRLKRMGKWASRIGLDFTANQRAAFRTTLQKQTSLRTEYYALSDQWNLELFRLARNQQAPDYDARMSAHLNKLWSLLENAHPEQWRKNRELWQDASFKFVQSMTTKQRANASQWIDKMGKTVLAISKDEPSFQVGSDPSIGCLVDKDS